MPAIIVLKDGRKEPREIPSGSNPELEAERLRTELVDFCDSLADARWELASEQNRTDSH